MRCGRAYTGLLPLTYIYFNLHLSLAGQYGVPVEIKVWDTGRTPLAHMVDVTNGFGLKVLAEHNFLNDNNIAFSPYGLMGIMVALYEGVDGESSFQIQRGMQLPWNRNIMRIGFRDLHRTLKTYFVPEEGFLAGLALNNENVTFSNGYKKILRFYGFDLENDQIPTLAPSNSSNHNPVTATTAPADAETSTVAMTDATASTKEETTANPNAETVDVDVRQPTEATTVNTSSEPNSESTTAHVPATDTTTVPPQADPTVTTEAAVMTDATSATPAESTTIVISTASSSNTPSTPEPDTTIAIVIASADSESVAQQTALATSELTAEPSDNEVMGSTAEMRTVTDATEITTASMINTESVVTEATAMALTETTESVATDATVSAITEPTQGSTLEATTDSATTDSESTLETLQRRKKSIVDFIFTSPPYVDDYFFYRSYNEGPEIPDQGLDHKLFLANGLKSVQVTYMQYDAVLEHAFLPHLEASALKLPLDSDRYYLLVVLPNRGGIPELGRLLGRMARESDLADIYAALRPRRVRATVPSFIVKGHVTLTTDLQKLGIRDVFEPRQRDFTLMTRQNGVYVRSIEQAVSVAIRKYRPDDQKKNRYVHNRDPVTFHATYPFLYFVMDSSIHVALMAGKMVDPLNSRIV